MNKAKKCTPHSVLRPLLGPSYSGQGDETTDMKITQLESRLTSLCYLILMPVQPSLTLKTGLGNLISSIRQQELRQSFFRQIVNIMILPSGCARFLFSADTKEDLNSLHLE